MRDCWKNRAGYDRVLMAVAATFLTVSATSALAQGDQVRNSAAELAIDAAIPAPSPRMSRPQPPTTSSWTPRRRPTPRKVTAEGRPGGKTGRCASRSGRRARHRPKPARPTAPKAETGQERHRDRRPRAAAGCGHRNLPGARQASRSRRQAMLRRRISRLPTGCTKCWAQNRCAISTARRNGRRWRNSTPRVNMLRCGRKPAN